ncbi:MAG: PEP-CTERM sorting domain-containing protein [Fimbriimonadaceae bacterium]|nr:PEP-CTERM sorting domain-containing protein [Fimbriimonadaceae bacterium]QYK58467.1 MAG: PEP-CTERM sorting domain-containing protein [Fimbriimonadaceae bacterium]
MKRYVYAAVISAALTPSIFAQVALNIDEEVAVPSIGVPTLNILAVRDENFVSATISGRLISVVATTAAFGDNLIFAWAVQSNQDSTGNIGRVTVNGWTGFTSTVAQHSAASLFGNDGQAVRTADRTTADTLGFNFSKVGLDKLSPGTNSTIFWALSDATSYRDSLASVINGSVAQVSTFAPVPEPGTMLALGAGLAALAARRKRS